MPERPSSRRGSTRADLLAQTFVEIADTLVDDFDVVDLMAHLAERCTELFDAADVGIVVADSQGHLRLMGATSERAEFLEVIQIQSSEGPCFDCFNTGEPMQVEDLAGAADRWPEWVPIATGGGFRSAHAFPLRLRGKTLGALNLFRVDTGRLKPSAVTEAQALADVATIAILQHRAAVDAQTLSDQLHFALNSRVAIEQAKGVIAQSVGVAMDEAFARLRSYARSHSLRLGDVAKAVIDGTLTATELIAQDKRPRR